MCKAAYFVLEANANGSFGNCCRKGSIRLAPITPGNANFKNLLMSLKSKVRQYNTAFSMVSMGVRREHHTGRGPFVFKANGSISHRIGSILPNENEYAKFCQIYFTDNESMARDNFSRNGNLGLSPATTRRIENVKFNLKLASSRAESIY